MKRIAIVGCGGMGGGHALAIGSGTGNAVWGANASTDTDSNVILNTEGDTDISGMLQLAGIYDIDPARMEWARERGFGLYDSFEAVLADPSVDIVLIATPNHLHKELAIRSMRAGKHVLCEKPVMMSSEELLEVMAVSRETGMVFYPRQNRRWDRDFRIVKELYEKKTLGDVYRIESRVHGSRGIPGDWRGIKKYGGGMMFDWGVHLLDRMLWLIPSKVKTVYATLSHITNDECDDGFTILLTFEDGFEALIEVGTSNFIALPLWYVLATNGSARIDNWLCEGEMVHLSSWEDKDVKPILAGAGLTKTMAPRDDTSLKTSPLPDPPFDNNELYANLVDVIEGRAAQKVTQEEALRVLRVMEAAVRSGETGEAVQFNG